jgi:hypothetical protein
MFKKKKDNFAAAFTGGCPHAQRLPMYESS